MRVGLPKALCHQITVVDQGQDAGVFNLKISRELIENCFLRCFCYIAHWCGRVSHMPSQGPFQSYDYMIAHYQKLASNWFDSGRPACKGGWTIFRFYGKEQWHFPSQILEGHFLKIHKCAMIIFMIVN